MAGLYLSYGSYNHQVGECQIAIRRESMVSGLGVMYGVKEHWDVMGMLIGVNTADVNNQVLALIQAYSQNGQDISLNGSYHGIKSANTLHGTRVVAPPHFPKGDGPELSVYRNYSLALEAEYPYTMDGILLEWQETISFKGTGGPIWKYQEYLNGPPQRQILQQASVCHATQKGMAVGNLVYPSAAAPIWPQYENVEHHEVVLELPSDRWGRKHVHWSYQFSSDTTLDGSPTAIWTWGPP